MFSRKSTAERTAAEAWDYLSSAMASAGESAKDAGKITAGFAGAKVTELAGKAAKQRHKAAKQGNKLAGKAGEQGHSLAGKAGEQGHRLAGKAGEQGQKLAGKAGARVSAVTDEAWARANLAANALAGRRPGLPWGLILGASLVGVALGWAAATTARAAAERRAENEELEMAETAIVVTPTYDN
ncbi:hypothetical protein [Pseudosporangium ferrugineum]|uniref:Uncharacterized protein n=1 Tax=Pseudosporangium ferrugineum TaxID=439699 RepID=A0A2T0REB9_9ACTN|nr:hypothetical protein [Pseudosporangium ferrugineum]PRY19481.1 hypothetical protein CLV70_13210 [Pseudosporangium ferrugineum]